MEKSKLIKETEGVCMEGSVEAALRKQLPVIRMEGKGRMGQAQISTSFSNPHTKRM